MKTKEFRAAVNTHAAGPAKDADLPKIVAELAERMEDTTRKAAAIGVAGVEVAGLRRRLIAEAEARWMRTRYATLDLSFAESATQRFLLGRNEAKPGTVELVRRLAPGEEVETTKTQLVTEAPVFVCLWNTLHDLQEQYAVLRGETRHGYRNGEFDFRHDAGHLPALRQGGAHYREVRVSMSVKMPDGITPEMFVRIRRCMAYLAMFDAYLLDRGLIDAFRGHDRMEVGVLWAPADDAWAVRAVAPRPAGEPAILVRHGGQVYPIGYFDTPDEKPIDNLIREFSTGKVRK